MIFKLVRKEVLGPVKRMGLSLVDEFLHINDPRPNLRKPPKPLFFVHVPKTAGTSFSTYLANHWNHGVACQPIIGGMERMKPDRKVKFYFGHVDFSAIAEPEKYFLITFLRDPIERCISQYKSWNDPKNFTPDDPWKKIMSKEEIDSITLAQKIGLSDFILCENSRFDVNLYNLQSRLLCDRVEGEYKYESAVANVLERFHFVGIVERFGWSIEKFRSMFSRTMSYHLPKESENRSSKSHLKISPKALQRLLDMNQHDINLYETVSSRFFGTSNMRAAA